MTVVEISFLYWKASMSCSSLMFFALLIGFVLGWIMHSHLLHRKLAAEQVSIR
ncbi:MAG: LapA family protein [Gallionella sp.]